MISIVACALLGILSGLWFRVVRSKVLAPGLSARFWHAVHAAPRALLSASTAKDAVAIYLDTVRALLDYLLRNAALLFVGLLPCFAMLVFLARYPDLLYSHDPAPPLSVGGDPSPRMLAHLEALGLETDMQSRSPTGLTITVTRGAKIAAKERKYAVCSSNPKAWGYALLLFEASILDHAGERGRCAVVRPYEFHGNFLWPLFDDLELSFLLTMVMSAFLFPRGVRQPGKGDANR